MRRIDTSTAVVDLFGPGKNGFRNGDPALAILATRLNAEFFNSMQEEVASTIEGAGLALSSGDSTQLFQALQILAGKVLTKGVGGGVTVTLSVAESRNPIILLTGVLTANINVVMPAVGRQWVIANNTSGAFSLTVKTASGSGVSVPQASSMQLYCDGANVLLSGITPSSQSVRGAASALTASATGLSGAVTVAADAIVVESTGNQFQTLRAVSVSASFGNPTGVNGLDVGAAGSQTASTWYYVWVIWNGTTVAGLLSLSATAPTMPSGYTHKALVSVVRTDGTANKYPISYIQAGSDWQYRPAPGSNLVGAVPQVASGSTASVVTAIGLSAVVPPNATAVDVLASLTVANGNVAVSPSNAYTLFPIRLANPAATPASNAGGRRFALEGTSIYWSSNASDGSVSILGFKLGVGG